MIDSSVLVAIITTIGSIFTAIFIYQQTKHEKKSKIRNDKQNEANKYRTELEQLRNAMVSSNTVLIIEIAKALNKTELQPLIQDTINKKNAYENKKKELFENLENILNDSE